MDALASKMVASGLAGYFAVFFKDFNVADFQLNLSGSETSTTLNNLELRPEIVQELMETTNFNNRIICNTIKVKVAPLSIQSQPIVISVDKAEVHLTEPWEKLKPLPQVLEKFLEKFVKKDQNKESSYGFFEKIVDGIRIEVAELYASITTVGKFKIADKGIWTPPKAHVKVTNVAAYTTNSKWEVVDLKKCREFNKDRKEIYVFKELTVGGVQAWCDGPKGERIDIINKLPITTHVTIRKQLDNKVLGISAHVIVNELRMNLKLEHLASLISMGDGLTTALARPDNPKPEPNNDPHPTILVNATLKNMSIRLIEPNGRGIELLGRGVEAGMAWPENSPSNERLIDVCVPYIALREFSARSGPETGFLFQPNTNGEFKDPYTMIPPLPKTLHPTEVRVRSDKPPMFYMKGLVRDPKARPKFDQELQALLNPVEIVIRPESVKRLTKFAQAIMPYVKELTTLDERRPTCDLTDVMVVEPKNTLEDLLSLKLEIQDISLSLPSHQKASSYNNIRFHMTNAKLMSHPDLPSSALWNQGLAASTEFPNTPEDLLHNRDAEREKCEHVRKFKVLAKMALTVQSKEDAKPENVLDFPAVNLDISVGLGYAGGVYVPGRPMEINLLEGTFHVKEFFGRLTQVQYKSIVTRVDDVLPVIPIAIRLSEEAKNVEVPPASMVFFAKLDNGECSLCNDYAAAGEVSPSGKPFELLAGTEIKSVQMLFSSNKVRKMVKVVTDACNINALPNPPNPSQLYNPNAFMSKGGDKPLFQMRFVNFEDTDEDRERRKLVPPPLKTGDRDSCTIRINGYRAGINPNPAAKIICFFLKTDRNMLDLLRTVKTAEELLRNVDVKAAIQEQMSKVDVDLDMDLDISVSDSRAYLLKEFDDGPRGNVCFAIGGVNIKRTAEGADKLHLALSIEGLAITTNKEIDGAVVAQDCFEPMTLALTSDHDLNNGEKKWDVTTKGEMNAWKLNVTPSHSDVFKDVVDAVKMQNIQDVMDALGKYMDRRPLEEQELLDDDAPADNPLADAAEQIDGWLAQAREHLAAAEKDKQTTLTTMKNLEIACGQSSIISKATKTGWLNILQANQKWVKRFFALNDDKLYMFESQTAKDPAGQVTINKQTTLAMVNNIPNCFQVTGEQKFTLCAAKEPDMTGWVNELIKVQCATGGQKASANDPLEKLKTALENINKAREKFSETAKDMSSQAVLLARLHRLEDQLKQRDARIRELEKK